MKRKTIVCLVTLILLFSTSSAFAQPSLQLNLIEPNNTSNGSLIDCTILNVTPSTSMLVLDCYSYTSNPVERLKQIMTVQRWTGSTWTNITSFEKTVYNTDYISDYKGYTFTNGYMYRVRVTLMAYDGSESDTLVTYSKQYNL